MRSKQTLETEIKHSRIMYTTNFTLETETKHTNRKQVNFTLEMKTKKERKKFPKLHKQTMHPEHSQLQFKAFMHRHQFCIRNNKTTTHIGTTLMFAQ